MDLDNREFFVFFVIVLLAWIEFRFWLNSLIEKVEK